MTETIQSESSSPIQQNAGLGRRLAEVRKAKGLSLEQAASQLRLNANTLRALENDDYGRLPPAAYVSGYLRSYARMLGVPEEEIQQGIAAAQNEPPIIGVAARSHTTQMQANDPRVRMVSYLVIGGLLLLSSIWWLSQQERSEESAVSGTEQSPTLVIPSATALLEAQPLPAEAPVAPGLPAAAQPAPPPAMALPSLPLQAPTQPAPASLPPAAPAVQLPAPVLVQPPVAAMPAQPPVGAVQQPTTVPGAVPAPAPKVAVPAPATPTVLPTLPAISNLAAVPVATETAPAEGAPVQEEIPPPPLTADIPQSKVVLEYTADCWTDVTDAAGRHLVYDLVTAGRTVTVRGEAPFTVFFGYSPGVQVYLNEQLFDHRPFQRRDTARFKMGAPDDNEPLTETD